MIRNIHQRFTIFRHARRSGQGFTEYLIMLALIALVSFAIVTTLGGTIKDTWEAANTKATTLKTTAGK